MPRRLPENSINSTGAPSLSIIGTRTPGITLDYPALLGCAWGRPSEALGPVYAPFDGPRRLRRLPGPPYHFMTRVRSLSGEIGSLGAGATVEVEYGTHVHDRLLASAPRPRGCSAR